MLSKPLSPWLCGAFVVAHAGAALADNPGTTDVGTGPGGLPTFVYSLSADGTVGVGTMGSGGSRRAFIYTMAGGLQDLGLLSGLSSFALPYTYAFGTAVSADGRTVVGKVSDAIGVGRGFVWTQGTGMVGLDYLNGGISSVAYAVSQDGSVIAGTANDGASGNSERAVIWSGPGRTVQTLGLGRLDALFAPYPTAISADGRVVVGYATDNTTSYAWRWASGDPNIARFMPTAYNAGYSDAGGITPDGTIIVGTVSATNDQSNLQAYRWQGGAIRLLGTLNGSAGPGAYSYGNAVNRDGSVIVGQASDGANGNRDSAYRWTSTTGMLTIEQWLRSNGLTVSNLAPYATNAAAVSADGCVVSGQLSNMHGYIARGCTGPGGLIDTATFQGTLESSAQSVQRGVAAHASLIMNGYHGSPMSSRLLPGQWSVSTGADIGAARASRAGGAETEKVGELSIAYGAENDITFKLGMGKSQIRQGSYADVMVRSDGTYVAPEVIAAIPQTPLYVSAFAYYQLSDASISRGYINAGLPVHSIGETSLRSLAARTRVDWLDALRIGDLGVTPYLALNYIHTRVGGYTETGGGFPVQWNAYGKGQFETRAGVDGRYSVNEALTLTSRLEGVQRLTAHSVGASGQILGLGGFSTQSLNLQRTWARAGVGFDLKNGPGTFSFMLNGSTENKKSYWAYANYKVVF